MSTQARRTPENEVDHFGTLVGRMKHAHENEAISRNCNTAHSPMNLCIHSHNKYWVLPLIREWGIYGPKEEKRQSSNNA
jgi:hypothetical protein